MSGSALAGTFHSQIEPWQHSVTWSCGAPVAVFGQNAARAPHPHEISGLGAFGRDADATVTRRIGWLLGWATPEDWFAVLARETFPQAAHVFVAATPNALSRIEGAAPFDWIVGYSLGALLLLREAKRATRCGRVALLAPIFAFAREEEMGGRVARAQVDYLARWLRRDRRAALADFYARAGLDVSAGTQTDVTLEDLGWGLERLARDRVEAALPAGWRAWCGAEDALLDPVRLRALAPAIDVVAGGTHHPRALLRAMAQAHA